MKWLGVGVLFAVFLSMAHAAPAAVPFADDVEWRLPKTVVPLGYDLTLTTNVHTGVRAFTGFVSINVEVKEETNVIRMNIRNLDLMMFRVLTDGVAWTDYSWNNNATTEFLTITNLATLAVGGRHLIEMQYTGQLSTGTTGFYRSSYRVGTATR